MTTSRTSIVNIHCPPSSSSPAWQVESGYYSDSYNNNSSSSMSNSKKQTTPPSSSSSSGVHPSLIPPPSINSIHRSSCHKRHQQNSKDIILCSCTHHSYLQHKINPNNNTSVLYSIDRYAHSNTNMKPISEHHIEHSMSSLTDSNTSPTNTSNDDESGSHSAMESNALSPLLPPPSSSLLLPKTSAPMIPVDHTILLSQIKTATRNSILLTSDNNSTSTNTYMADSGFDSSSSHAAPPPVPPPIPTSAPCTAFMIQTQTGNALLIPHSQGTLMSSSNIDPSGSNINNGTLPLRSSAYSCPSSTQLTTAMSTIDRPNSNSSNVYQTIDADSHRDYVIHSNDNKNEIFPDTPLLPCFRNNCYVYPLDHHHHHSHSHMHCNCDSTTTYNEQTTTTTRQSTHSPCPLFNNSICRSKKRQTTENYFRKKIFSWKILALILLLTTICFLTSTIYLSIIRFYNPAIREINFTQAKSRQQSLFFGKTTRFIRLGDKINEPIDSQSSTQLQFYVERTISIQFNFSAREKANFGIYGKRSSSPSLTQFDFFHPFNGNMDIPHRLVRRSLSSNRTSQIYLTNSKSEYLTLLFHELVNPGLWYLTIINDGLHKEEYQFHFEEIDDKTERLCPNNCNNRGICQNGVCVCQPSYTGVDCSIAQCTDLCSGHGVIEHGQCRCHEGWHGAECQLMLNQCEIANCNNHGTCLSGKCVCQNGYQGKFCEQISCRDTNCSHHGICLDGKCRCFHGYTNDDCSVLMNSQCDNRCSGHGTYVDYPKSMCICDPNWTGDDCSQIKCNIDCGLHGQCLVDNRNQCQCDRGWSGENCQIKTCSKFCNQCDTQGNCQCPPGSTGRFCQINTCPNNCNGHGDCQMNKCVCHNNWFGSECQFTIENNCNDRIDNDNDGLIDCLDPDCCSSSQCQSTEECISRPSAKDILLRRQAPSPSASFFERMQFLIQEDGLQTSSIYSSFNERASAFNKRRASVIRGQIFYKNSLPLNGVKVQVFNSPQQGYTISDKDGFFNLLINAGGSVLIQFIRQPFQSKQLAFQVPWNTFLHIGHIHMDEIDEQLSCQRNFSEILHPKLWDTSLDRKFQTNEHFDYGYTLGSQILRQTIEIDKSDLPIKLVYLSSSSPRRYQSILTIVLTGTEIEDDLVQIHLRISIEGNYFSRTVSAENNLIYEYQWSRRNAYDQNVHGLTEAIVSIGYEYLNCKQINWQYQSVKITGQDIPTANVGGWTFNVHHKFNLQSNLLHKGDGTTMYLTDSPIQLSTVVGIRNQIRSIDCRSCQENPSQTTTLFSPTSLTISHDGRIFIADLNFIWMYQSTTGLIKPVLELTSQYTYRYHLTTDPIDGRLYISDYNRRQIIRLIRTESIDNLRDNFEVILGNGDFCQYNSEENQTCGDNQLARDVSLTFTKGLTIDRYGNMFFIDGQRIRKLNIENGLVTNFVGSFEYENRPLTCNRTYSFDQFKFSNPTVIHIHPLDGDLYVLDEMYLYRIRIDLNLIEILLSQTMNCLTNERIHLSNLIDFTFNSRGDLLLLEKSFPYIHIRHSSNPQLELLNINFPSTIKMHFSSVMFDHDQSILISNLATKEIFRLKTSSFISEDELIHGWNIPSKETNEIYVFNRVGQHRATIDALTGETMFNFTYDSPQNAYGKLESIHYRNGRSLVLKYDYAMRINEIFQMPNGKKLKIEFSKQKYLSNIRDSNGFTTEFLYDNGLLTNIIKNNLVRLQFNYDQGGHIQRIIHEDGFYHQLIPSANHTFYRVKIINPIENRTYLIARSQQNPIESESSRLAINPLIEFISTTNRSSNILTRSQTVRYNSTDVYSSALIYPMISSFDNEQKHSWQLDINNRTIYIMSFDPFEKKLTIQDSSSNELYSLFYSSKHRLISRQSRDFQTISYTYRDFDQKLINWKLGPYQEEFLYDTQGRLIEIQRSNDLSSIKYSYGHGEQPVGITYGSQMNVMLRKDSSGCITGLIMPNQAEHNFEYRTYFNRYRLIYSGLHRQIWEYDSNSNLHRIYFPSQRLITYKYDEYNRLIYSFADGLKTSYDYQSKGNLIQKTYPRGQILEEINEFETKISSYYDKNSYYICLIQYHNPYSFELRLIYSKDYQRNLLTNYAYQYRTNYSRHFNEHSGFLQSNSLVRITYPTKFECFIKDLTNLITISRRQDDYQRLKQIEFFYKNQQRLTMKFVYNNQKLLLEQIEIIFNDLERSIYQYEYDQFKRLTQIKRNQQILDSYQYDWNNNLNSTRTYPSIEYNQWNQIQTVQVHDNSTMNYQYDQNGFLHVISSKKFFVFNSFGLLIQYKDNEISSEYIYDSEKRLILKFSLRKNSYLQLIYGNQDNRKQITHIYNSKSKLFMKIFYDNNHHLIAFEINDKKYFVLTDSIGSPLFIYDQNGLIIQEKFYGLYGQVLYEKIYDENVYFPFGYAGLFIDDDLNCAFDQQTGKLFDLNLGRYLVANFPSTWTDKQTFQPILTNPFEEMNLYKIPDEIYNFNERFFKNIHEIDLLKQIQIFNSFQTESTSLLSNSLISYLNQFYFQSYPNQFTYSIAHIANENDFWLNRTLLVHSSTNQIEFESFQNTNDNLLNKLFNQSYLIPYRDENQFYFIQNLEQFQQLKTHFNQPVFRQFKINLRYQSNEQNQIDLDIFIENRTIFHMKFGSNFEQEYQRLIEQKLSQMKTHLWQIERTHLMDKSRLFYLYPWSQNEIEEIITNGYLANYTIDYRYDPLIYPDIADDSTNFIFKMKI